MKKEYINVIGKTKNNQLVVNGLFKMFDTMGTPLYVIFELCNKQNWIPSWIHFYDEAYKHGWKHKTIINRLKEGMEDIYEPNFIDVIIKRLNEKNKQ